MSESIQVTPSNTAGAHQSKFSSLETGNNPEYTDDSSEFTTVIASYIESEPDATEQKMDENLVEVISEVLPEDMLNHGNMLPEDESVSMWQALLMIQPDEKALANTTSSAAQNIGLFDNFRKPMLNSQSLNQSYFQSLTTQNKEAATSSIPAGVFANNIGAQLAAAHFMPESNESLMLNMTEQLMPIQGTNNSLLQGLAAVGIGSGTVTQVAATQTQMAPLNLGQNAWETNLGSRLQMLVGQNVQSAEIRLDPPELGALDIKIKVTNDVATVNISSSHTQVREALETAIPRLREMFEESGLSLGDVNVRQESFSQHEKTASEDDLGSDVQIAGLDDDNEQESITKKLVSESLLDIYA